MRDFLVFLIVLAVGFFAIGETVGWDVGLPGQTPVFVYKRDGHVEATRRALNIDAMPVKLTGKVRHGSVTVRIDYQRAESFQTGKLEGRKTKIFEQTYRSGERIGINQSFQSGTGDYTVVMTFDSATGVFNLKLPGQAQL